MLPDLKVLADAVLLEGHVHPRSLGPASPWPSGVLAPKPWSEGGGREAWWMEAQLLVEGDAPVLAGELRFLQTSTRAVVREDGTRGAIQAGGRLIVPWEELELREIAFGMEERGFDLAGARHDEPIQDGAQTVGAVVRTRRPLHGRIGVRLERAGMRLWRAVVRVENLTPFEGTSASREVALQHAMASAHLLLQVAGGRFVSLRDPPAYAQEAAAECRSTRLFPVLARMDGETALAAPVELPEPVAPASHGDLLDAAEVDEVLDRRTARLAERRAGPAADRVEALSPGTLEP